MTQKVADDRFYRELLALSAMNPFFYHNSSPRGAMFMSHVGQCLVMCNSDVRRTLTGLEYDLANYTFAIRMPCDAEIIKRIERYPSRLSYGSIRENPETLIIYEDVETKEVGVLSLTRYKSMDRQFGFRYDYKPVESLLVPGKAVRKGTIIADSPSVTEDGIYKYGVEANVAFMSVPAIIEDGVVVRRGFLEKMATLGYESRVVSWGKNFYPLNLYGDENNYKPFPDIGDTIREDGLLYALRKYDDLLAVADMTPEALMTPDFFYDQLIYAEPGAKVVDVIVHHDSNVRRSQTPVGMEAQAKKYWSATSDFHKAILKVYYELKRVRGANLKMSKEFHRLVTDALADKGTVRVDGKEEPVTRTHRLNPIDEWRVEVVYEYKIVPTIGFKLTGVHGDKGVICDIWEDEDMPVDELGNRADIIMDGDSTTKRMNIGRAYEQYINASARETAARVRTMLGRRSEKEVAEAWNYLSGFYRIVAPKMVEPFEDGRYPFPVIKHLEDVARNGIHLHLPPENEVRYADAVRQLRHKYPAHLGPVTYRGRSGNLVTTKKPVLIGSMYILLLEKTGGDWSGVSSAKLQHFGIPAKLTNQDKFSNPGRAQPVRFAGETEVRLLSTMVGSDVVADILDQSNNPLAHKEVSKNIILAPEPGNVKRIIDREKIPVGNGRPLAYVKHVFECAGIRITSPKNKLK